MCALIFPSISAGCAGALRQGALQSGSRQSMKQEKAGRPVSTGPSPLALLASPGAAGGRAGGYSRTWMFFLAQMSFNARGQTVTLTSPRWAFFSSSMAVRDWPMPPPIDSGIWSFKIAW